MPEPHLLIPLPARRGEISEGHGGIRLLTTARRRLCSMSSHSFMLWRACTITLCTLAWRTRGYNHAHARSQYVSAQKHVLHRAAAHPSTPAGIMAARAGCGADISQHLAELLGKPVGWIGQIRKMEETPPRISVIDVAIALTGKSHHDAAQYFRRISEQYPEVGTTCSHFRFKGRGQRDTPITTIHGVVKLVFLLPGRQAAHVRRQAAELFVRYLGGDLTLVDEVCALRGFQEQLALRAPDNPRRLFGE